MTSTTTKTTTIANIRAAAEHLRIDLASRRKADLVVEFYGAVPAANRTSVKMPALRAACRLLGVRPTTRRAGAIAAILDALNAIDVALSRKAVTKLTLLGDHIEREESPAPITRRAGDCGAYRRTDAEIAAAEERARERNRRGDAAYAAMLADHAGSLDGNGYIDWSRVGAAVEEYDDDGGHVDSPAVGWTGCEGFDGALGI